MPPEPPEPRRPFARAGTVLNLLLLALVFCGYAEAERWRTAWLVVAAPVAALVLVHGWHMFPQE